MQKLACSPNVDRNDMINTLEDAIKNNGIETDIRNIVFHLVRNKFKPEEKPSQTSVVSEFIAYVHFCSSLVAFSA